MTREDIARAVEMLTVAANYIDKYAPADLIHYDEAMCDGSCVADDCRFAADALWSAPSPSAGAAKE